MCTRIRFIVSYWLWPFTTVLFVVLWQLRGSFPGNRPPSRLGKKTLTVVVMCLYDDACVWTKLGWSHWYNGRWDIAHYCIMVILHNLLCLCVCVHARVRSCMHACMRACVCVRACACMRACVHACMHACMYTCMLLNCICACMRVHMCMQGCMHRWSDVQLLIKNNLNFGLKKWNYKIFVSPENALKLNLDLQRLVW